MRPSDIKPILDLNRMVHEPVRLAILTVLASSEKVGSQFLQRITGLNKGHLSSHTQKLEAAGCLATTKAFQGRIPVASFRISAAGKRAFEAYRKQLLRISHLPFIP
jgi:DNA-binding PadR family transcriptional regulator